MVTIFDLDYTIFNTKRFKENLAEIFRMSTKDFNRSYWENFKAKGINYKLEKHLQILEDEEKINHRKAEKIREEFSGLLKEIDKYIFPEVEKVVKFFKHRGDKLVLASFGDLGWQELKINNLAVKKYFNQIVLEEGDKSKNEFFQSLKEGGEEISIINDNAKESLELKKELGEKCDIYLIQGPYSHNVEHDEKIHEDLTELLPKEREKKREKYRELQLR